jgi:hypothetical protein
MHGITFYWGASPIHSQNFIEAHSKQEVEGSSVVPACVEILKQEEVRSSGSSAVDHFISHTITDVLPFYPSRIRSRQRNHVNDNLFTITKFISVAGDVDVGFTEANRVLGREDKKCAVAVAAAEPAVRMASWWQCCPALTGRTYESGGFAAHTCAYCLLLSLQVVRQGSSHYLQIHRRLCSFVV